MFCTKCGNEIESEARFCSKCGKPINLGDVETVSENAHKKKNSNNLILIVIGVVIVALICTIFLLIRKDNEPVSADKEKEDNISSNQGLDLEQIVEQCSACENALNSLIEVCELGTEYGYDKDELMSVSLRKCEEMQHNCTADVIQVENVPYVYRCCYGYYTGQWQGAGPSGTGTFVGKNKLSEDIVSYSGDWAYGLPNGTGELYIENFLNHGNNITYSGNMSNGKRNGNGYMHEYIPGYGYMVYGETVFENDVLAQETEVEVFDKDTGEVKEYLRVKGEEDGSVYLTVQWYAGELSPEQQQIVDYAQAALVIGLVGYMGNMALDGTGGLDVDAYYQQLNDDMMVDLNAYNERKEAERQEMLVEQEKKEEKIKNYNQDLYEEDLINDPKEENDRTKVHKYNAGLGN